MPVSTSCLPPAAPCAIPGPGPAGSSPEVRQSDLFTFSRQRRISIYGKRILAKVLSQIQPGDAALRDCYQFHVNSLADFTTLTSATVRSVARQALDELMDMRWYFREGSEWYGLHLLDTTKRKRCGIEEVTGIVTIIINPELAKYFLDISNRYTVYQLDGCMRLNNWYAMRLYEILSTYRDTGWWEVSLADYRQLLDCGPERDRRGVEKKNKQGEVKMRLADSADLISNTVEHARVELVMTPLAFDYQVLREATGGRSRPRITGLRFTLHQIALTAVGDWMRVPERASVIERLRRFQVSDANIAKYLPVLGLAQVKQLMRDWELKENSSRRIDNKLHYCNAVVVRVGQKLHQQQQQLAREELLRQTTATNEARRIVRDLGLFDESAPGQPTQACKAKAHNQTKTLVVNQPSQS